MGKLKKVEKVVIIDKDGNYSFIGYSEKEVREALDNPELFDSWLEMNTLN